MLLPGFLPSLLGGKEVCAQPLEPFDVHASAGSWMWSLLGCPTWRDRCGHLYVFRGGKYKL